VFEAFGGGVAVLVLVGLFAATAGFEVYQRRRAMGVLEQVAAELGLSAEGDGLRQRMRGVIDGVTVEVSTLTYALGGKRGKYTRLRLTVPRPPPGRIAPASLREQVIGLAKGEAQLITGDEAFDAAVRVYGERGPMFAHLSAEARRAIVKAASFGWKLADGVWEAIEPGRPKSAARVRAVIEAGVAAAKASQGVGTTLEALAERAKTDPVEAVRAAAEAARRAIEARG